MSWGPWEATTSNACSLIAVILGTRLQFLRATVERRAESIQVVMELDLSYQGIPNFKILRCLGPVTWHFKVIRVLCSTADATADSDALGPP